MHETTAAVIWNQIQAKVGIIPSDKSGSKKIRNDVQISRALLHIIDENSTGFGRKVNMFLHSKHYGVVP